MCHTPGFEDYVIGLFGREHQSLLPIDQLMEQQIANTALDQPPEDQLSESWSQGYRYNGSIGQLDKQNFGGKGVRESAGINRFGIGNESVLRRRISHLLWPRPDAARW